uniref:hypothetical protein n=1 Tax=Amycolatopsis sp. CA-082387 TaxID=3239918 RepID=UPI003F49949D
MTAPSTTRTAAADIADRTGFASVELHDETGQWSVWISADQWWGFVDAAVLDELVTHDGVYGVTVTRRHDGRLWIPGLTTMPQKLANIAHSGLQLTTATASTDMPDGALAVCLHSGLSAHQTVIALRFWLNQITVHDAVFGSHPDAAGFVRLNIRGTLPDGTRLVVVGLFHRRTAPNAVRIVREEIERQDVRGLLDHLLGCADRDTCSHR